MGRTRNRAERLCFGCGESQQLNCFSSDPAMSGNCYDCRVRGGEITPSRPPSRPRLMQELRAPGAAAMTESECSITSLAQFISDRDWPIHSARDEYEMHQRLMSALFAAGYHVLPTHGPEIRVQAGVSIDCALGATAECVSYLLSSIKRLSGRRGGLVLITESPIDTGVVDGIERHTGMPLYVHTPNLER